MVSTLMVIIKSSFDPCRFINEEILNMVFVDDFAFCARTPAINKCETASLRTNFYLTDEGELSSFLGVSIHS